MSEQYIVSLKNHAGRMWIVLCLFQIPRVCRCELLRCKVYMRRLMSL